MNIEELLKREYSAGSRVINCVVHMDLDITKRPDDCLLCLTDLRNEFSLAASINAWLNVWKRDATEILISRKEM